MSRVVKKERRRIFAHGKISIFHEHQRRVGEHSSSSAFLSTLVDVDDDEERMFAKIARSTNEAHSAERGGRERLSKLVRRSKTDRVIVFHRLVTKTTLRRHKNWFIFSITSGGRGWRWSVCVCASVWMRSETDFGGVFLPESRRQFDAV